MERIQLRWTVDDAERLIEAINAAQEHTVDQAWNRDVQVIKMRLHSALARADLRAARAETS